MSTTFALKAFESSVFSGIEKPDVFNDYCFELITYDDDKKSLLELDVGTSWDIIAHVIDCKSFTMCVKCSLGIGYSLSNIDDIKTQLDKLSSLTDDEILQSLNEINEKNPVYRFKAWQDADGKAKLLSIFADLKKFYTTALEQNLTVCFSAG